MNIYRIFNRVWDYDEPEFIIVSALTENLAKILALKELKKYYRECFATYRKEKGEKLKLEDLEVDKIMDSRDGKTKVLHCDFHQS